MRRKTGHLKISLILSLILTLITTIAIVLAGDWHIRHLYNIFFFTFFNFSIFSLNTLFFSKPRKFFPGKLRKFIRISITIVYTLAYTISVFSYIGMEQIARIQTIMFLLGSNPLKITLMILGGMSLILIIFISLIHKKSVVEDSTKKEREKIRKFFYINIILLALTFFVNISYLHIENEIIDDNEALVLHQIENIQLKNISKINASFEKPNVIFILLESISTERVGIYGYEKNVTPNIDRLANKSIMFSNAYTTSTHSDYAQPGILSSRYMITDKTRTTFDEEGPRKFIWDIFKEENYTTGYYSSQDDKWQGMDEYYNFTNLDNYSYSRTDGKTDYGFGLALKDYDHKTTDLAINWLEETSEKEEPFFLYMNLQGTHNPLTYPENFSYFKPDENNEILGIIGEDNYENRYDNSLRYVDAQVGRIINFIEENNLSDNTIIAITSDHGHDVGSKHGITGHGKSIYNEELIVPAIIFIPEVEPTNVKEKVSNIDFIPTLIDLLGYPIPKEFQGNIMKENRPLYFVTQSHKYMIGMVQNNTKVIIDMNRKLIEVYNLENDPEELYPLDTKQYKKEITKLLFWHYCQIDYYDNEKWTIEEKDRCSINNNFKI